MPDTDRPRRTVGEIDSFVTMLRTACENDAINRQLQRLLLMPDRRRRAVIRSWINDLIVEAAPQDFIEAIACLLDDAVAEKAYEVIYQCRR